MASVSSSSSLTFIGLTHKLSGASMKPTLTFSEMKKYWVTASTLLQVCGKTAEIKSLADHCFDKLDCLKELNEYKREIKSLEKHLDPTGKKILQQLETHFKNDEKDTAVSMNAYILEVEKRARAFIQEAQAEGRKLPNIAEMASSSLMRETPLARKFESASTSELSGLTDKLSAILQKSNFSLPKMKIALNTAHEILERCGKNEELRDSYKLFSLAIAQIEMKKEEIVAKSKEQFLAQLKIAPAGTQAKVIRMKFECDSLRDFLSKVVEHSEKTIEQEREEFSHSYPADKQRREKEEKKRLAELLDS